MSKDSSLPYLRTAPVIPGRALIPGRETPEFPCHYRVQETTVTFNTRDPYRSERERREHVIDCVRRVEEERESSLLLVPSGAVSSKSIFGYGWTLIESDGRVLTHQCVVFLKDVTARVALSDQGVICVAAQENLSAWDGREENQSRACVA